MVFKRKDTDNISLQSDLEIIEDIFDVSDNQLAYECGISTKDIKEFISGEKTRATKEQLESIYNYAFNKQLYLNSVKWQMYVDDYRQDDCVVLCHGSRNKIVGNIRLDMNGNSNDFANGFYCGESLKQAGMFVADEPDSSLYILKATLQGNIKKFNVDRDWMLAVAYYRDTLQEYEGSALLQRIVSECENADTIIAPIADNRMFELIDSFIAGELTDKQCLHALSATQLGSQYVFKTQKSLDNIELLERCYLCSAEKGMYNRSNALESNAGLTKAKLAKKLYSTEGKYITEIL